MSDTLGAIILAVVLLFLLGPLFLMMAWDGITAAAEMWRDLWRRNRA